MVDTRWPPEDAAPCWPVMPEAQGGTTMASWRLTTRRRSEDFQSWAGRGPVWDLDGVGLRAPVFYHRADLFETIHLASLDAVQDVLPSDDLYPVRWFDGRALVLLAAYRYQHVSAEDARGARQLLTPYGEISVAVVVTRGKPRRRGLGLVQAMISGGGGFILDRSRPSRPVTGDGPATAFPSSWPTWTSLKNPGVGRSS